MRMIRERSSMFSELKVKIKRVSHLSAQQENANTGRADKTATLRWRIGTFAPLVLRKKMGGSAQVATLADVKATNVRAIYFPEPPKGQGSFSQRWQEQQPSSGNCQQRLPSRKARLSSTVRLRLLLVKCAGALGTPRCTASFEARIWCAYDILPPPQLLLSGRSTSSYCAEVPDVHNLQYSIRFGRPFQIINLDLAAWCMYGGQYSSI